MPLEVRLKIFQELWGGNDFDLLMVVKDYEDRHNDDNPITLATIAFVYFFKRTKEHWPDEKIPWDKYASCLLRTEILWFHERIRGGTCSNKNYYNVFNLMMSCKQLWEEGSIAYWRQRRLHFTISREFGEIPMGDEEVFSMPQCADSQLLGGSIGESVRNLTLRFDDKVLNCRVTRCNTVPGLMGCKDHPDDIFIPKLHWAHDTIMKALRLFTNITCLELLIENDRVYDFYDGIGMFGEIMNHIKEERPLIKVIRIKGGKCADLVKQWNRELDASVSGITWSMSPCVPSCQQQKYEDYIGKFDVTPREVDQRPDYS
ncbi:hypothetical protein TARUN_8325 [Trichoderma arundinaceum]|uniref:Uncharacterized protein n=1 Tax=Trichoderma arundinaceum TaxID=490622 RepID=A0A395NDB1_TRIAR|nr:hypothetical protein TARUN_8325 [Trichoderma arundinaceum]